MKIQIYILLLVVSLISSSYLFAENPADFFEAVSTSELKSRGEICDECDVIVTALRESSPVQANLISAFVANMVENNPKKGYAFATQAVEVYRDNYKNDSDYKKRLRTVTLIKEIYKNLYEDTKKELEIELSKEDFKKWEEGTLKEQIKAIDEEIERGSLVKTFAENSIFIEQIIYFENK